VTALADAEVGTVPDWSPPRPSLVWLTVALSAAGLGVSGYLTAAHYTSPSLLVCSASGAIDCAKVTTSSASRLFGIPVAVLGLVWFVPMLGLSLPAVWRSPDSRVAVARLAWVTAGIGFVVYLIYAELFVVGAICLWCSTVHLAVFLLFVAVLSAGLPQLRR